MADIKIIPYPRPFNNGEKREQIAIGPSAAYCPKDNSINIKGNPAMINITLNGMRNAPVVKKISNLQMKYKRKFM